MKKITYLFCLLVSLSSCALLPPDNQKLSALPVIPYNENDHQPGDHILYFQKGSLFPFSFITKGNLIVNTEQKIMITLNRDIYVYKQWASYDQIKWCQGSDLIKLELEVKLPGYENPHQRYINFDLSSQK